jgi:NAD(P)-dependent dehydrogenase (short-subunit alcohol dehydrogenase family)
MNNQTILITGGNTGIGKAIAVELAKQSHHVVITSRNENKGQAALDEIRTISNSSEVDLVTGDLSNIQSVKDLAVKIIRDFPETSVLINNAGIWPAKLEVNADGLEMAFMVNHMAPFILSHTLLPLLIKNKPARIVNINAKLYSNGKFIIDKTPYGKDFSGLFTYMNTKLCNIFFTQNFSDKIRDSGVTINACHPGVFRTNLISGHLGIIYSVANKILKPRGIVSETPIWLAVSPDVSNINGGYFESCLQKPYTKNARNAELSAKLWDLSRKLAFL